MASRTVRCNVAFLEQLRGAKSIRQFANDIGMSYDTAVKACNGLQVYRKTARRIADHYHRKYAEVVAAPAVTHRVPSVPAPFDFLLRLSGMADSGSLGASLAHATYDMLSALTSARCEVRAYASQLYRRDESEPVKLVWAEISIRTHCYLVGLAIYEHCYSEFVERVAARTLIVHDIRQYGHFLGRQDDGHPLYHDTLHPSGSDWLSIANPHPILRLVRITPLIPAIVWWQILARQHPRLRADGLEPLDQFQFTIDQPIYAIPTTMNALTLFLESQRLAWDALCTLRVGQELKAIARRDGNGFLHIIVADTEKPWHDDFDAVLAEWTELTWPNA